MQRPWIVLKFGGTSVASAERWAVIAARARELLPSSRVWIVASALAGVSDKLEQAVREALAGRAPEALAWIVERHRALAGELGVDRARYEPVAEVLADVERRLEGVRLAEEAPPRLVARIMAAGELASTRLGLAALAGQGVAARWVDARELLASESHPGDPAESRFLSARVAPRHDPAPAEVVAGGADIVLTQGFIARTPGGDTCLLGRGGSDTSATLFAALLGAAEVEIWTDVPGMFTTDPRAVPSARLIRRLGYREAQELAASGAKVLHPGCLASVAWAGIPLGIRCTPHPELEGTRIEAAIEDHPVVTAVTCRKSVALVTISTVAMWEAPGFLARAFAPFAEQGISIDLVATSESAVSVTLDHIPGGPDGEPFAQLLAKLRALGRVDVTYPCGVVSIVGRRIRAVLHEIAPALAAFQERPVHLLSQSSEDLNFSFVVDQEDADPLVARLHEQLFGAESGAEGLGPTWEMLRERVAPAERRGAWWEQERERLLALIADGAPRFVYHLPTVRARARELRSSLRSVDHFLYAMKANAHGEVLRAIVEEGFGLECVSAGEIRRAREIAPGTPLLFTPNFCPLAEYEVALEAGALVTLDGPHLFEQAPGLFRGIEVAVRADPGRGFGHHEKVRTAGAKSKFGHPLDEMDALAEAAARGGAKVVGLHAHLGSGILDPQAWLAAGRALAPLTALFPDVRWIDAGGGLGVPERPGQSPLDLGAVEAALQPMRRALGSIELWLEPGRYLVSEAGVLLATVTQVRRKGKAAFAGLSTGMNSLIRPALYGAWHGVHNLTRIGEPPSGYWTIVGPICESGDVLGRERRLPETRPGDVLLIQNAGAYGAVMSSRYNLRDPAAELALD